MSAYSTDKDQIYVAGEMVYVKIPEGNFDNKKIIDGRIDITETALQDYNQEYTLNGTIILDYEKTVTDDYEIDFNDDNNNNIDLENIAKDYDAICISADILTFVEERADDQSYAISATFTNNLIDTKEQQTYVLKSSDLLDEGLSFGEITTCKKYFDISNGLLKSLDKITIEKQGEFKLFEIKNIKIRLCNKLDLSNKPYILSITSFDGNEFTEKYSQLGLTANFRSKGKSILDPNTCTCKWFKRSDNADKWKQISDGSYTTAITVEKTDVPISATYKLEVVYHNEILVDYITIYNRDTKYKDFAITKETEGENTYYKTNTGYFGDWYILLDNGSKPEVVKGIKAKQFDITQYLKYTSVSFWTTVYNDDGKVIYYFDDIINNSDKSLDCEVSFYGDNIFYYDKNGDIEIIDSDKTRVLRASLKWKENRGNRYAIQWLLGDRVLKIGEHNAYTSENSQIENVYIKDDKKLEVYYNLKKKYDYTQTDNVLTLRLVTNDSQIYDYSFEPIFKKQGEQTSNGSTYSAALRVIDKNQNRLNGYYNYLYKPNQNYYVKLEAFQDGKELELSEVKIDWKGYNIIVSDIDDEPLIKRITITTENYSKGHYISAVITSLIDNKQVASAVLPISVLVDEDDITSETKIENTLPQRIQYRKGSVVPAYYQEAAYLTVNGEKAVLYANENSAPMGLREQDNSRVYDIVPVSNYSFVEENEIGVITCKLPYGDEKQTTKTEYEENDKEIPNFQKLYDGKDKVETQNILKSQITKVETAVDYQDLKPCIYHSVLFIQDMSDLTGISGWDGTKVNVDNDGGCVLSPTFGAGTKDIDGKFSGVVMGVDSYEDVEGIYGYSKGTKTFGLKTDGTAFFGSDNGRIDVDGKNAVIYGGKSKNAANSMTLKLYDDSTEDGVTTNSITGSTTYINAIEIRDRNNEEAFSVDYDGHLVARNADIEGTINATYGKIGGWNLGSEEQGKKLQDSLFSKTNSRYNIILSPEKIKMNDSIDYALEFSSSPQNSTEETVVGKIGGLTGNNGQNATRLLGIAAGKNCDGVVVDASNSRAGNIRFSASDNGSIYLDAFTNLVNNQGVNLNISDLTDKWFNKQRLGQCSLAPSLIPTYKAEKYEETVDDKVVEKEKITFYLTPVLCLKYVIDGEITFDRTKVGLTGKENLGKKEFLVVLTQGEGIELGTITQ